MYSVQEVGEEQERQYNQLMQEDDQYCHPESFKWGFEHGLDYALTKVGWHPASELPPVDEETGFSQEIYFILDWKGRPSIYRGHYCKAFINGKKADNPYLTDCWCLFDKGRMDSEQLIAKWWCYPPEKD